jgi:hypothetical protein
VSVTSVYLLCHSDGNTYEGGEEYVRGVFTTREAAEAALVTRTSSGARSKAWDAHNESCCGVEDWELQGAQTADAETRRTA